MDQVVVATEGLGPREQEPRPVSRVGRADKSPQVEGKPLTFAHWRGLSTPEQLGWLRANIQVQQDDEYRLLAQIETASRPKAVKPRCGCPPGGWPKKEKVS